MRIARTSSTVARGCEEEAIRPRNFFSGCCQALFLQRNQNVFVKGNGVATPPKALEKMSIRSRVYLSAFVKYGLSEYELAILPAHQLSESLAPTVEMSLDIFKHLFVMEMIKLHPDCPLDIFTVGENDTYNFDVRHAKWMLNISHQGKEITHHDEIGKITDIQINPSDHSQLLDLWIETAAAECIEFLAKESEKANLHYQFGPKTKSTLWNIAENLPVSQIMPLINSAVKSALMYQAQAPISRQQAACSIIGKIERLYHRAISEKWTMTKFRRRKPPSTISDVLGFDIFRLDDEIINIIPSLNYLKQTLL